MRTYSKLCTCRLVASILKDECFLFGIIILCTYIQVRTTLINDHIFASCSAERHLFPDIHLLAPE